MVSIIYNIIIILVHFTHIIVYYIGNVSDIYIVFKTIDRVPAGHVILLMNDDDDDRDHGEKGVGRRRDEEEKGKRGTEEI